MKQITEITIDNFGIYLIVILPLITSILVVLEILIAREVCNTMKQMWATVKKTKMYHKIYNRMFVGKL